MQVLGVDGCKAVWFAVRLSGRARPESDIFDCVGDLWRRWGKTSDLCLVDVPIGLAQTEAARTCDTLARKLLGPRASSVFNPPVRSALHASAWSEAADINESKTGKRLTLQTWNIIPKIREVDQLLRSIPKARRIVRESHPEVLFHLLNDEAALQNTKSRSGGVEERLGILERYYPGANAVANNAFERYPRRMVKRDDLVDALACAIVALVWSHSLTSLPERPSIDSEGLPMEMVLPGVAQARQAVSKQ